MENICRFIRTENTAGGLTVLNFVHERRAEFEQKFITHAGYSLNVVTGGEGYLHTAHGVFRVRENDIFVTFSAKPYFIENSGGLEYIYTGFTGIRAAGLLERAGITPSRPVINGGAELTERWKTDFAAVTGSGMDLAAEGLILSTLAAICGSDKAEKEAPADSGILQVKKYIDLNYTDSSLTLKSVSMAFGYSPKYVSAAFMKLVMCPFSGYLNGLRMKHAAELLESGVYNISETASECGFRDALYFSKAFKKAFGVSPKQYRKSHADD